MILMWKFTMRFSKLSGQRLRRRTAVSNVTLCIFVKMYWHITVTCCFHLTPCRRGSTFLRNVCRLLEAVRNVMAHGDALEGKWRGNRRLERVATTLVLCLGTWSIHGRPADLHSTASSRLNWLPRRFKWTRAFLWKTKSGFCACVVTFQTCYTTLHDVTNTGW